MSTFVSTAADADEPLALLGRIVTGGTSRMGALVIDNGRVASVEVDGGTAALPARRLRAAYVAAGFVDLQVNGGFGHEVGEDPMALRALARRLPATGVTSFLPTLVSRPESAYAPAFAAISEVTGTADGAAAARILGVHLEGPLLSPKRAGAHAVSAIEAATPALLERIAEPRRIRLVTLAPEVPGALALIARLTARGIVVSLGHTDASFEAFTAGVDAGATLATHVWNAMPPFHHRSPGAIGAALADQRVTALAIADGIHTHPATFAVMARAKGPERLGLVTDAIAGAGAGAGRTTLAGQTVTIDATGARLTDGTLAGSALTMDLAVRNARTFAALSAETAIHLATAVPARALGHDTPALRPGSPADVVLLDEELTVLATFVGGRLAYVRNDDVDALRA